MRLTGEKKTLGIFEIFLGFPGIFEIFLEFFSGPNSYAKCQIEADGANRFVFSYVPLEVGAFNVTLKWNNRELAGSPYRVRVSVVTSRSKVVFDFKVRQRVVVVFVAGG